MTVGVVQAGLVAVLGVAIGLASGYGSRWLVLRRRTFLACGLAGSAAVGPVLLREC
jgi:hypothetical protein